MKNLVGIERPVRILERRDGDKPFGPVDTHEKVCKSPGLLPIMAYTGRLPPKGVPFSGFRCKKG